MVHDAVLQWAYGVNKSLTQGLPPDDGYQITQNIFNSTFEGITGTVTINNVGDRLMDLRYVLQTYEIINKPGIHSKICINWDISLAREREMSEGKCPG